MRLLAIDLGGKRTGFAIGETEPAIASPLRVIETPVDQPARLIDAIEAAVREHRPDALVLGLPLNMDESEGPQAKKVRAFAHDLAQRLTLPIHFQDERLSTADADWLMAGSGLTRAQKKDRRDALAAAAILRDFIERQPRPEGESD